MFAAIAYRLALRPFLLVSFVLAMIEEALIYYLGGGLQGEATSLLDDYANALPVFAAIIFGWYLILLRYEVSRAEVFLGVGLHGIFLELVLSGAILNPILLFLLGGPTIFIYGSILIAPQLPRGEREFTLLKKFGSWIFVLLLMVLSGIVGAYLDSWVATIEG